MDRPHDLFVPALLLQDASPHLTAWFPPQLLLVEFQTIFDAGQGGTILRRPTVTMASNCCTPRFFIPFLAAIGASVTAGCAVTEEISLQHMDVSGQVNELPVKVTDHHSEGQIVISPRISLQGRKRIEGRVDLNEPHPGTSDSTSKGKNFRWDLPSAVGGIDVDVTLGAHAALALGADLSSMSGRVLAGWTAGVGFFREDSVGGIRFDLGVHSSPSAYEASTVVVEKDAFSGNETRRVSFLDRGRGNTLGFYGSLTLNTRRDTWPLNLFLNISLFKQSLVNYTPTVVVYPVGAVVNDARASCSQWMAAAAPGVFFRLSDGMRILLGSRFVWPLEIADGEPGTLIHPFAQLDFAL